METCDIQMDDRSTPIRPPGTVLMASKPSRRSIAASVVRTATSGSVAYVAKGTPMYRGENASPWYTSGTRSGGSRAMAASISAVRSCRTGFDRIGAL